jgi:hypothetical protein
MWRVRRCLTAGQHRAADTVPAVGGTALEPLVVRGLIDPVEFLERAFLRRVDGLRDFVVKMLLQGGLHSEMGADREVPVRLRRAANSRRGDRADAKAVQHNR